MFLAFFPLWQIWGFTLCKDVYYYLGMLLWVTAMAHIFVSEGKTRWWQWFLAAAGVLGVTVSRKDGIYLILFFAATALLLCIGHASAVQVKLYGLCTAVAVVATIFIHIVYMPMKGVENGPVREMLSIPFQQTARYVLEHGTEITSREGEILEELFGEEWDRLAEVYKPEISDPVKDRFLYRPTSKELSDYAWLWWQGFTKHPNTYAQAFLNHVYGYFYPNAVCNSETRATYLLGGMAVHYTWDGLDIWFAIENREVRDLFEAWAEFVYQIPGVGLLGSCGVYTYLLIGCFACLKSKRKGRQSFLLIPALGTLLIAMISPVGTCVRYMLPVMALLPLNVAWCIHNGSTEAAEQSEINSYG